MVDTAASSGSLVIPIRLIRSFEYRNIQHIVMKDVSPHMLGREFLDVVLTDVKTRSGLPPPFKKFQYDTVKIEHKAHGAKTSDPVINTEKDEVLLVQLDKSLSENGIGDIHLLQRQALEDSINSGPFREAQSPFHAVHDAI
ncbi:UPF0538 protein C2orf76-like [Holothuria leucospilota]|uniref:UPF0538 protein C2orf76-like n=1 Tax=Holothuria leucospilota TaxID=206669 RepID=A0A9Q0YL29_HOLLE|nr:UPF0538 protein C2orf76-like [Holothuria leucospilota]